MTNVVLKPDSYRPSYTNVVPDLMDERSIPYYRILGLRVDAVSKQETVDRVRHWAEEGEGRYVCVANVHMIMEAYDDADFAEIVNFADLVIPDGRPLSIGLGIISKTKQEQVRGPDTMKEVCRLAEEHGIPVGLYGGKPETLNTLREKLIELHPMLDIRYAESPPFRELTDREHADTIEKINLSGVKILFVGLGCPKQERWMAENSDKTNAVMLGVGAAFDIHAEEKKEAPKWMQDFALEWLFRLVTEPGHVGGRYLKTNPRFLFLFALQLLGLKNFTP